MIRAAALRAGIARRTTPHKLRHTYATRLLQRGADIIEVRDLLGHASVSTTQVYLSSDPERLRGAVDRL
jgi:integrase/recombinase XerD